MSLNAAFRTVNNTPGIIIWRIEKMDLVQVPQKAYGNFFEGDCYILLSTRKSGNTLSYDIHYWIGNDSTQDEQGSAAIYTTQLDDYLGGGPVQHREVQGYESDSFKGYFKQGIIYKKGGVASGMKHVETNIYNVKRLLHVKGKRSVSAKEVDLSWSSFNIGDVFLLDLGNVIIQWNGPESNTTEKMKDCYILDQGGTKIYVWKGKGATKTEKQTAMSKALEFINMKGYPRSTNVETVNDGAESAMFKQLFQRWSTKDQAVGMGKTYNVGKTAKVSQEKFDASLMHAKPELAAQERMVDDGSGKLEVWRIENLELMPVEPEWFGFFYGGDCYLILYTYDVNRKSHYILYIWQGRHATQDELAASAFLAVQLDQDFNGEPVQVRVNMGKEPRHFMAIFKGKLVLFEDGTSRKGNVEPEPPVRLFQIHGTHHSNTKAVEVPAFASSLNSNDVFLLKTQTDYFLWYGKGSSGDEREMAKQLAGLISSGSEETLAEGQETVQFWELLGGKAPYANDKRLQQDVPDFQPRLFECSNKTGRFIVSEVRDFTQDDLNETDVMLLDTWDQILLWIGIEANDIEKKEALTTAQEYLRTHPSGRDIETPIMIIKQGFEPPTFTGWFLAWDPQKWSGGKSYEQLKMELGDAAVINRITSDLNGTTINPSPGTKSNGTSSLTSYQCYPLHLLLKKEKHELPEDVDPSKKEHYLSEEDFVIAFGLTRGEFAALPIWKQLNLKKEKGLF